MRRVGNLSARGTRVSVSCAALAAAVSLCAGSCGPSDVIEVRALNDGEPGSLRAALDTANTATSGSVRIEIPPGTYELTRCSGSPDENENTAGDLDITTDVPVTLSAPDGGVVILQKCSSERVLDSHGTGVLVLAGVTLAGGNAYGTPEQPTAGGGLRAAGDVILDRATIRDNRAQGVYGDVASDGSSATPGGPARGGGLYVGGSLMATDATLQANTAQGGEGRDAATTGGPAAPGALAEGGAAYVVGAITLTGGTIRGNRALGGRGGSGTVQAAAGDARGGGLAQARDVTSSGDVSTERTEFTDNAALGGAITTFTSGGVPAGSASGGALSARNKLLAKDVAATQNSARSPLEGAARGGALDGLEVTVTGGAFYANSATVTPFVPRPYPGGPNTTAFGGAVNGDRVSVTGAVFTHNSSSSGGAVAAATAVVADVDASDNTADNCGGALFSSGRLTVSRSRISENQSIACGGGVAGDSLVLTDTVLFGNRVNGGAQTTPDVISGQKPNVPSPAGAGAFANTTVEGTRVTFARHRMQCASGGSIALVPISSRGGGIAATTVNLVNATIVDNALTGVNCTATSSSFRFFPPHGLGIYAENVTVDHVTSTDPIRATHLVTHRSALLGGFNLGSIFTPPHTGTIDASSYTFFAGGGPTGTGTGDQVVDPEALLLAPFGDNGGLVPTRAPGAGSPLINAVPVTGCGPTDDARGVARPQGPGCDIGAVEVTP